MRARVVTFSFVALACSPGERADEPKADPAPSAATVTLDQFKQLQWIAGTWLGSGGSYPAFYEEYRLVDDSTIQMRAFSDSTFGTTTDSSWIELRNGTVGKRGGGRSYIVIALTPDSVRFAQPGVVTGGHTFTRMSADEWRATLHPSSPGGQATVYTMRRLQR